MKKRTIQKAAGLLALSMACVWCAGCGHKDAERLEEFRLEEGARAEGESFAAKDAFEKGGSSGGTEEAGDEKGTNTIEAENAVRKDAGYIFVYVCGAVRTPGVYRLEEGARLYEAIACAGGVREDAAEESVNQAQAIADGERLYIPTEEEVRQGTDEFLKSGTAVGGMGAESGAGQPGAASVGGIRADGKVNINTASREELTTLNGIGDSRAASILAYRESNGPFGSIEDLMKVEGIKEGVFNKLKDNITVN